MDILSNVLNIVRLNGGAFYTAEFTSPWAVFTPSAEELARLMGTRAESVAVFHIFVEGECWISLKDTEPFSLSARQRHHFFAQPVTRTREQARSGAAADHLAALLS